MNEIRDIEKSEMSEDSYHISEGGMMLIDTIRLMEELSNIARKKGLLELEKLAYSEEIIERGSNYLRQLIGLVVDGADPDLTEEMGDYIYFTAGFSDYKALQYLLMLKGILEIQKGTNLIVLKEILFCMLPEEIREAYFDMKENQKPDIEEENDLSIVEKLCESSKEQFQPFDDCYYVVKMLEQVLMTVSDRGIQRLLRDVNDSDLSLAMMGLSGEARRIVFNNLSEGHAIQIANDMGFQGPVRFSDVGSACKKIFEIFLKLLENAEIAFEDDVMYKSMAELFLKKI
ncbi:MAG: hypothetical protein K6A90_13640 [Lachnospiraceae bacterium]|nr:hypothetical protein [Lachnospiraceae bacterium]